MGSDCGRCPARELLGSRFVSGVLVAAIARIRAAAAFGLEERDRLESALIDLSRVFYYAEDPDRLVALDDELGFAERYLRLQALRFEDRLEYSVRAEPGLEGRLIPRLSTMPLLERATAAALELAEGRVEVSVAAERRPRGRIALRVSRRPGGPAAAE